jgi:hypothetical protein
MGVRRVAVLGLVLAALVLGPFGANDAQAQETLRDVRLSADVDFPDSVTFTVEANAPIVIDRAEVRYRIEQLSCGTGSATGFAAFTPSAAVDASWEWGLRERGGLPVGARVTFWWVLSGGGRTFETEPTMVIFEDPRFEWRTMTGDHTRLLWYSGTDDFARELLEAADAGIRQLQRTTGVLPSQAVEVRIYEDAAAMRDAVVEVLFDNDVTVAKGLLPPGLPGYNDGLKGIPFDPEGARALLAQSKYGGSLPDIVYTTSGLGGIPGDVQFLVDAWSTNLGVDVEVRQLAPDAYFYTLYEELDNLFHFGWIADYPDPENFLDVLLHSEAVENNVGHYSNAEYDRLLEEARTETDTGRRMALYQQAEQILVDDAGFIPLYHAPDYVLTKPFIEGFAIGPLGIPLLQNVTIGDGN